MEGPLGNNNKTTFSFSGRRSYIDMLMRSFSEDSLKSWYTFFDYSFKLKHRFNAKNSIQFTIFQSRDRLYSLSSMQSQATYGNYSNSEETNFNWGSLITSLQYNKILNNRTFSNFGIYLSKYRANFINENHSTLDSNQVRTQSAFDFYFKNVVRDISAYINFTHNVSKFHSIDYGIKGSLRGYFPGTLTISTGLGNNRNSTIRGNNTPLQTTEISTYLDNQIQINPNTKLQIGARAVNYNYYAKHFLFFEPRANLNIRIKNEWALKAGYTLNNQNILYINQQNENFDMILNNRWLPATDKVLPQRSHQINLGFAKPYKNNIELNIEGYYKLLQRSIDYKEGTSFKIVDDQWEQKLLMGTGSCYGIETMLHKRKGDLSGWISYTLSWANRNTKGVNRGQNYYYQYDRRHYVNIVAQYKWDERTAFSANIVFSTGNLQSLPTAKYKDINGNTVYDYPYKNNYRLPNTFRIDIGIKRIRAKSIGVESGYNFSIYNLLCRQNPSYIYIDVSQSPSVAYQVSQLGVLIPGISYYIKF